MKIGIGGLVTESDWHACKIAADYLAEKLALIVAKSVMDSQVRDDTQNLFDVAQSLSERSNNERMALQTASRAAKA